MTVGRELLAGVDVGGSKVAVLLVDRDLAVRGRLVVPTAVGAPDEAAEHIAGALEAALTAQGATLDDVAAVGVGVPGRVDPGSGLVSLAVNLGWHELPLGERLEARLGVPVAIENDVRAAAAGIRDRRLLGDVDDFIYLSVGTGISAGVVLAGSVHRGTRGLAGEVGHVIVEPGGVPCACGLRGCLETVAAGPAIARVAREAIAAGRPTAIAWSDGTGDLGPADVYGAAAAGDELAGRIVATAGVALARAVHALAMTYDVERVLLGGGVSRAGAAFLDPILAGLADLRAASELTAELLPVGSVGLSPDGTETGSWGAVTVARAAAGLRPGERSVTTAEEVIARDVRS